MNDKSTQVEPPSRAARILEIGPYPPPFGGWSQRIALLQRAIVECGEVCTVLNIGTERRIPSPDYECVRSISEYVGKLVHFARRRFLFHLHINGSSALRVLIALVAAAVTTAFRRRPVLTFHAGEEQVFFPRQRSVVMTPLLQMLFHVSRCIICNNEGVRRRIAEYGVAPEKIIPIPAFSRQYLSEPRVTLNDDLRHFLDEHAPAVLAYTDGVGADSVLAVLDRLRAQWPHLGVIVVSPDWKDVRRELQERPALAADTLVVGPVSHAQFLTLLASVSMYLRCRAWDGASASVCEALASGTPVVANDTGSRPASVRTFAYGDQEAMWAAMTAVLRDPEAARREVEPPPLDDTLQREVDVLLGVWEGRRPSAGEDHARMVPSRSS